MELLSLLLGGLFRLAPNVVEIFHKKQENAQELALLDKQIQLSKVQAEQKREEIAIQSTATQDAQWSAGLLEALKGQAQLTGVPWVDAVNATLRPFLTYYHCVLIYTLYKVALFYIATKGGISWDQAVVELYTDFDRSLVGSMLSFWFVDRALRKFGR